MEVRVYRSLSGDCLFITGADGSTILVDGGLPDAYEDHWMRSLHQVHNGKAIDLVMVSHIDRDHIGGILAMLDHRVAWKVYEYQSELPVGLRTTNPVKPDQPEPHDVKAIWHNAFFEEVRTDVFSNSGVDVIEVLSRSAAVLAGETSDAQIRELATRHQFLGQSVGDAIELSRRISAEQLNIPLNPEFNGGFMVRKVGAPKPKIGGITATILGPTEDELKKLLKDWNKWVEEKTDSGYLGGLLDDHDEDAIHLPSSNTNSILDLARTRALEYAGNQRVTPPNLASLIVLLTEGNQRILLAGDADDPSILQGLEDTGLMDANGRIHVDIFKVPHHGAHNSYSDALASRVTADQYIFCGDGDHGNPEQDVVESYLVALFEGGDDFGPAAPAGKRITFWFNCSSDVALDEFVDHWVALENVLDVWKTDFPLFSARFLRSGQSFVVE